SLSGARVSQPDPSSCTNCKHSSWKLFSAAHVVSWTRVGNSLMTEDIRLISLAAWLHRQAEQFRACADSEEYGARATLETAARLAQASRIVREAADRERGSRKDKLSAANES